MVHIFCIWRNVQIELTVITFIYKVLLTVYIVSKELYSYNRNYRNRLYREVVA